MQGKGEGISFQNSNENKPGRDVISENIPDVFFPLHMLQASLTSNPRLDSASRRNWSVAVFYVDTVSCFCTSSQSSEI